MNEFNVTVIVVREYSATLKVRARTQSEAEKIAIGEYNSWLYNQDDDSQYYAGIGLGFPPPWREHETATCEPEIDTRFHCVDCGKCTSSSGEYYMVSDNLWAASGLGPNDNGMLCLRCLEQRIGRELTLDDFTAIRPRRKAWERHVAERRATPHDAQGDLFDDLESATNKTNR